MYENFYQLQSNPFSLTPDPRFCFRHTGHRQAREYLEYALNLGEGMVMVTGRPGTGKTTLVESFITGMHTGVVEAVHIAAAQLDADDLLRAVAYAFGIDAEGQDRATLRFRIRNYLKSQHDKGRRALLVIDEAQGLPYAALDELRLLADLQIDSQQLLQLFLVGQEPLHELLAKPEMDFFQQRVIASYQLVPLGLQETRDYIEYRLTRAGWQGLPAFTGAAVRDIHQYSAGVPRHINKLCNRLLLLGYGKGCQSIGHREVQTIAEEMGSEWLQPVELQRVANGGMAIEAGSRPAQSRTELDKLAIRRKRRATMTVVRSDSTDESQTTVVTGNTGALEAPAGQDIEPSPVPMPVAVPVSQPAEVRHDRTRLRAGQVLLVVLIAGLAFAGLSRVLSTSESELRQVVLAIPPLAAVENSGDGRQASGGEVAVEVALPQGVDDPLPAPDTNVLTARRATDTEPPLLEAHASAARAEDLQVTQVAYHRAIETGVIVVEEGATEVESKQVVNAELSVPAAGPLLADEVTDTDSLPVETRALASPADELQELLAAAQQAFVEHRLLMPPEDSAYHYFQSVLHLAPGNAEATQGISKIVQRYITLSIRMLEEQNDLMATRFINRGLRIQPDNATLLALREKSVVPVAPEPVTSEAMPSGSESSESVNALPDETVVDDERFLSRLKGFLNEQGRAETHSVPDYPMTSSFVYE